MTRLPDGWRSVTLDELQANEPAAITDGPFGSNLTSAHYTPEGPRVVRLQNIGDGVFNDAHAHIAPAHFEKLRRHAVLPGDLLIASLGEALPRACLAPENLGPAIVKADCIRLRLADSVEPRWVLYALQNPALRAWAADQLHGVGRPRLGLKVIRTLQIPLPPLVEQQRIVDVLEDHLSRLDAGRNDLRAARKRLLSYARAARHQLTTAGASSLVPLQALVGTVEAGRSFGVSARPAAADEWGIVKVSAMTWGAFDENQNKAVLEESRVERRFEILPGDLLVSRANTTAYVGASVVVPACRSKLLLSDKSLRLVPRADVDPRYIHALLQAPEARDQISRLATGTKDSMRNISQSALLSITVPSHAASDQAILVSRVDELQRQVGRLGAQFDRSALRESQLRRSLLGAAFSGRL